MWQRTACAGVPGAYRSARLSSSLVRRARTSRAPPRTSKQEPTRRSTRAIIHRRVIQGLLKADEQQDYRGPAPFVPRSTRQRRCDCQPGAKTTISRLFYWVFVLPLLRVQELQYVEQTSHALSNSSVEPRSRSTRTQPSSMTCCVIPQYRVVCMPAQPTPCALQLENTFGVF